MRTSRKIAAMLILAGFVLVMLAVTASAAEIKGVRFDDRVVIHGVDLNLKGLAVLKWAMLFDVYAGGFYLPEGISAAQWTSDVPKKLELSYFRDIKARGFADASDKLLRENLEPSAYQALAERLQTFYSFFQDVSPGDRYSINYTPGRGTELRFNDQAVGRVPGHDFAVAYFGIWLGDKPLSKKFRDALLGVR